ncbi:MAG TPA: alpha/beta family hydrolase [Gemmatimonadales bacterium]|nr:alpha/beta family hydrolase [Gemmatimonadales bacterium]
MTDAVPVNMEIHVGDSIGSVSAILLRPKDAWAAYVLAHGAGAGMRHRFMETVAQALAERGVATLRYQFPYVEAGSRRPDPPGVLEATVRAAVAKARECAPDLPLFAGGKSLGGRMTSSAAARRPLDGVRALAFLGFPLHPAKQPGTGRAEHLNRVPLPMLFLQGTRDDLADLSLVTSVSGALGERATLHVVEGADHSFAVLKRSGRTDAEVMAELADTITDWFRRL